MMATPTKPAMSPMVPIYCVLGRFTLVSPVDANTKGITQSPVNPSIRHENNSCPYSQQDYPNNCRE